MEDLSISMVRTGTEAIRPTQTADTTSKAAETLKEQNKDDSSRKERIQEVLKDVIAVSKDGDTAQASKISQDKLKETEEIGDVKELKTKQDAGPSPAERAIEDAEKAKAQIEEAHKKAEAAEKKENPFNEIKKENPFNAEKKENPFNEQNKAPELSKVHANQPTANTKNPNVRSFDSYTDAQLRQMYIKGDISRYDYDHEITTREESGNNKNAEIREEKVFQEGIVRAIDNEEKAERSGANIERAFDEEANDNMKAEQRMAMVDAAELTG
ncbi:MULTISPECIES: hypothetical protein [unclassified Butyrivibrio]|uniref:hypothetical protein n=1 Tax=unclassified Butyrivibrio TaxID=2639466 RepID=UPI0003B54092|nr:MULTISPECIES: hypothetical protein [unclassified Butyrivibrio]